MSSVVCIFPKDNSTDFLIPIYESLETLSDFKGFRIDTNNVSERSELFSVLSNNGGGESLVVFLGHGASYCLYGSPDSDGKVKLFDKDNINILSDFPIICLACNSKDFLKNKHLNYIGFGDIPSDFFEVEAERNLGNPDYLSWANDEDIISFRKSIVDAFVQTVKTTHCDKLSNLYGFFKLLINKRIATLLMERNTNHYREIADMLYDFADEMELTLTPND